MALPPPPGLPPELLNSWLDLLGLLAPPGTGLSLPPAVLVGLLQVPLLLHSVARTAAPSSTLRARVAKSREHFVSPTFSDAGLQKQRQQSVDQHNVCAVTACRSRHACVAL